MGDIRSLINIYALITVSNCMIMIRSGSSGGQPAEGGMVVVNC